MKRAIGKGQEKPGSKMEEEICLNCHYVEGTYPLDPPGTLHCEILEKYVSPNDSCRLQTRKKDE